MYMRQRAQQNMGAMGAVALAAAAILLYSLWGASLMQAQKEAVASGNPAQQLAVK
jgi:hypothetical protein